MILFVVQGEILVIFLLNVSSHTNSSSCCNSNRVIITIIEAMCFICILCQVLTKSCKVSKCYPSSFTDEGTEAQKD